MTKDEKTSLERAKQILRDMPDIDVNKLDVAGIIQEVKIPEVRRRLIEAKALRLLKHPNRVRRLVRFLDGEEKQEEK